jgi:hypothetical protein
MDAGVQPACRPYRDRGRYDGRWCRVCDDLMTPSHTAFDYERDDAARRIRVRPRRALNVYEYIAVLDRQAQEGTWSYGVLWDLSRGTQMLAQTDADLVASHVYSHLIRCGSRGPVAVVTDEHAVVSSTRAYASKTERAGMQVAVFPTVPAAEQWLSQKALPWADAEPAVQPMKACRWNRPPASSPRDTSTPASSVASTCR